MQVLPVEKPFAMVTETDFDQIFSVNVKGTYFTMQAAFQMHG